MKSANTALQGLFATDQHFEQFDLYTFTLQVGLVLRYTNCPFDVVTGGNTFLCARSAGGVQIDEDSDSGPRAHWTSDLSTGTWSVAIMPRDNDVIGTLPWKSAVKSGLLDEATVKVERGYLLAWPSIPTLSIVPIGTIIVFVGSTGEIDFGRSIIQIQMNDPRQYLDTDMPRNVYSGVCRYALFDTGCTLVKATFAVTGLVNGVTDNQTLNTNIISKPDDYFSLGEAQFTSGMNSGLRCMIRQSTQVGGMITLLTPMPYPIMNGDTLTLFPGCDKTQPTCTDKFNNLPNFGGAPYIPVPETAI